MGAQRRSLCDHRIGADGVGSRGHRQIEAGRPFEEILHDVVGPDGSSIAFVSVAVDLALSHWAKACDAAWPMVATPELLQLDDERLTHDLAGVDRMSAFEREPSSWRVKRGDLHAKPSRRSRLSDTFSHYVFNAGPEQLEALRAGLEQARDEIRQKPNDHEDPTNGLRATAERAVRMTNAEHWPLLRIKLENGSEMEVRQFQRDPEELRLIDAKTTHVQAEMRHLNIRAKVQIALFDRAKSTAAIVAEGIEWAKALSVNAEPQQVKDDEPDEFNDEWDRRAVVMAAALAGRDYEASDRSDVMSWAEPLLHIAAAEASKEYLGNSQIEYDVTAIAALGLIALFLRDHDAAIRSALLKLAGHQHLSVVNALCRELPDVARADDRLPRALVRIVAASAIHFRRGDSDEQNRISLESDRRRIEAAIQRELRWFDGVTDEPTWPELPRWFGRSRPGARLKPWSGVEEEEDQQVPELYVDEHRFGAIVGQLVRLTPGDLSAWLVSLAEHLMHWTLQANGTGGEGDTELDNRPIMWNGAFLDFLGVLCVALPNDQVIETFLKPMSQLPNEAFYDAAATFLRGFDRATIATDARKPENPAAIRVFIAERLRGGWGFRRLAREKSFSTESHFGDVLNAMFYQPWRIQTRGHPHIPAGWPGLKETMPTLTGLVQDAPSSGYLAILFLNLVESSPTPSLLPFVVQAMTGWCSEYGIDANFWSEREIGPRICTWLERSLDGGDAVASGVVALSDRLATCLDILVRSGVAQACEIEERILR